ncbi:site-specific DNA-methyltransferase [Pedobacter changchengzhani]|uniref:site-specific DNA-methyltransferase (adenine-specific) n=1 Tax=Pedobacter changchengzhani TaxID=2529274 RepID=A0A4R5MPB0_9SPHI|nr:site-specific DNA-methyltransferase [Pedobacter changchengzhani]TDG37456.1 site-specific DNA-methyltransferase [Pedobacter changchengzhani]
MKLYTALENVLKKEPNFVTDNNEIKKWVVISKAQNFDAELIGLLLDDPILKEKFFIPIKEALVFNQSLFIQFLEQKSYLNDSYTAYKNKVGLNIDGKFLKQRNEVALVWPFKDCVLEGGQSREEDKREEIFFNEILAQDEINQLLEPKVFTNAKRYSVKGEKPLNHFNRNAEGTITDNLIIKGNNLLALHTLKEEFAGKVKLIYIDPPYNTGNDGFKYNDSFNHSSWLTFMKNRLEIAKQLLSQHGSIFIQIDDFESAYLKILMDEVFGRENFRNQITWKRRGGSANPINRLNNVVEYIIWYSNTNNFHFHAPFTIDDENTKKYIRERFNNIDENGRKFMKSPLQSPNPRPNLTYDYKGYKTPKNGYSISIEKMKEWDEQNKLWFPEDKKQNINRKVYLDEYQGQPISSLWTDISVINPMSKERSEFENGQKPEALLKRIVKMCSNEKDIILDFHIGSGTTVATCHKLNRQYIGIEQMNYIETIAVERLTKVVLGEQDGISKSVNWQGGGEFVYLELKKYNQTFIEQIEEAKNSPSLLKIWEEMKAKSFLNYNIDIQKQDAHIEDFKALTLQEQKQQLVELLDKNQLYVNLSSINDKDFSVTPEEKKVTKDFYQIKN